MSSRAFFCIAFMLAATAATAVDWGLYARQSDPSLDPILLDAMANGDQETRISICVGVARRPDPAVGPFLETLASTHAGVQSWQTEHCLRVLLAGLLDPDSPPEALAGRASANESALNLLFRHEAEWRDPQLLGLLMRAAALLRSPDALQAVMTTGDRITDDLEVHKGFLLPQEFSLALDFLAAARQIGSGDLLSQCADIARLSRDQALVEPARAAARELAGLR